MAWGFDFARQGPGHWWLYIPLWAPAMAIGLPTAYLWRRRLRRPGLAGLCAACSYDLTGNTTGVCPECEKPADGNPADNLNR